MTLVASREPPDFAGDIAWHEVAQLIQDYQSQYCPENTCQEEPTRRRKRLLFGSGGGFARSPFGPVQKMRSLCGTCRCDAECHEFGDCCPDLQVVTPRSLDTALSRDVTSQACDDSIASELNNRLNDASANSTTEENDSSPLSTPSTDGKTDRGKRHQRRVVKRFVRLNGGRGNEENNEGSSNVTETDDYPDVYMQTFSGGKGGAGRRQRANGEEGDETDAETTPCHKLKPTPISNNDSSENDGAADPYNLKRDGSADRSAVNSQGYTKKVNAKNFECTDIAGDTYWTINACHHGDPGYTATRAARCRQSWRDDPLSLSPVTVVVSSGRDVIFSNQHCALCHEEKLFTFWQVRVMCRSNVQLPPLTNATQLLQDALHERGCDVNFLPPPSSTPNTCLPKEKVISNCSQLQPVADHHAAASQRACTAYTSPFHADGEVFGNMFCYLCNGGREEDLSGGRPCLDGGQTFVATASSLLTFMQRPREVQRPVISSCQPDAVYDPSEARCKKLVCPVYREAVREADGRVTCQWIFREMAGINILVHLVLHVPTDNVTVTVARDQINPTARKVIASLRQQLQDRGNMSVSFIRVFTLAEPLINATMHPEDYDTVSSQNPDHAQLKVKLFRVQMLVRNKHPQNPDTTFSTLFSMFSDKVLLSLPRRRSLSVSSTLLTDKEFSATYRKNHASKPMTVVQATTKASFVSKPSDAESLDSVDASILSTRSDAESSDGETVARANTQNSAGLVRGCSETVVFSIRWPARAGIGPGMLHSPVPLLPRLNCPSVRISASRFAVREDGVVSLHVFDTSLRCEGCFQLLEDGDLLLCVDAFVALFEHYERRTTTKREFPFLIIVTLLQSVGLLCLVLTIAALLSFQELRTVPGYNLLFLALSLLLAQAPLALPTRSLAHPAACLAAALALHYCWLCVFGWMTVASCHMYRSFRNLLRAVHPPTRTSSCVKLYCLLAFGVPLLIVAAHVSVSHWFSGGAGMGYARARGVCFVAGDVVAVVTFATPLVLTVLTTSSLLALSVCSLQRATLGLAISRASRRTYSSNLVKYCKLSTLTGLTWGVGVAGELVGSKVMVMTFDVLSGGQGLFLFLAFIANRRTGRLLLSALKKGPKLSRSRRSNYQMSIIKAPAATSSTISNNPNGCSGSTVTILSTYSSASDTGSRSCNLESTAL